MTLGQSLDAVLGALADAIDANDEGAATAIAELHARADALGIEIADVRAALAAHIGDTPPVPMPAYGRINEPRTLAPWDTTGLTDYSGGGLRSELLDAQAGVNLDGATVAVDRLYLPEGKVLANGHIVAGDALTALRAHGVAGVVLADLLIDGGTEYSQNNGVVNADEAPGIVYHNVRVPASPEHGIEAQTDSIVRGCDVGATWVGLAGTGYDGTFEDSRFRFLGVNGRGHWGASKLGQGGRGRWARVEFLGGCLWFDSGRHGDVIVDALFEGSPTWGLHVEIANMDGDNGEPATVRRSTFRNNGAGRPLDGRPQHAHITAHLAPVIAEGNLIQIDLRKEVGFLLWDEDGDPRIANRAPNLDHGSAGSQLSGNHFEVTAPQGEPLNGDIVHLYKPDRLAVFDDNLITAPAWMEATGALDSIKALLQRFPNNDLVLAA